MKDVIYVNANVLDEAQQMLQVLRKCVHQLRMADDYNFTIQFDDDSHIIADYDEQRKAIKRMLHSEARNLVRGMRKLGVDASCIYTSEIQEL